MKDTFTYGEDDEALKVSPRNIYFRPHLRYFRAMKRPYVYILANKRNGTLYIGVTSNLPQRLEQHRTSVEEGFTKRYTLHTLVWCEEHDTMLNAIAREKMLKKMESGVETAVD